MFSGTDKPGTSTDETFIDELQRLKRTGASVLVVGVVRPDQRRDVCRRLLGHASRRTRRRILVSTTSSAAEIEAIPESSPDDDVRLINYDAPTRSAAADSTSAGDETDGDPSATSTPSSPFSTSESPASSSSPSSPSSSPPTPTPSSSPPSTVTPHADADTLSELGIAISSTIESFETDADGLAPSELRVGIESLLPLLEAYDRQQVFTFLHLIAGRTTGVDGMLHCHLPVERDATVVAVLSSLFDIVVELREQNGLYQERWILPHEDIESSGWLTPAQA